MAQIWRMAFRWGNDGPYYWEECKKAGIASLGYYYGANKRPIVKDCSRYTVDEFDEIWRKKDPKNSSARNSLKNLAYRMRINDIIYVKQGPMIVGRGKIISGYKYDDRLMKKHGIPWEHCVKVRWDKNFKPVRARLGTAPEQRHTLFPIDEGELTQLKKAVKLSGQPVEFDKIVGISDAALPEELPPDYREGNSIKISINKYERDPKARRACLKKYGYSCSACSKKLEDIYGAIANKFIVVHHLKPIASIGKEYILNAERDLRPVCPDCHAIIHKRNPPFSIEEVKDMISKPEKLLAKSLMA